VAVGQRNGPAWQRFNGDEGVSMAGEGGGGVLQLEEETGDEGRSTVEGDDGRWWELTEGGSRRWRRASGGWPWTGGKGVGVKWCSWHACKGGREGGKQRGGQRQGRLLSMRQAAREGERGPSIAVSDRHQPVANGHRLAVHTCGALLNMGGRVADPWARGHSNGRRGLNRFKNFKCFENVQIFQTLIDPNLTFPHSKNLK
jgi:hypothetical protein